MKYLLIILLICLSIDVVFSQQTNEEGLITDRPDQTESAVTVGKGKLQIETGFLYIYDQENGVTNKDIVNNSTLLRYGLLDNFELRLTAEFGEIRYENGIDALTETYRSPVTIGLKTEITEQNGWLPEMAILTTFILNNLADPEIHQQETGFDFKFAAAHQINNSFSLGYNFGAEWNGVTPGPVYFYSIAAGISLLEKLGCYIEPFGYLYPGLPPEHIIDGGFTWLILNNLQFDVSAGKGLSSKAPDLFLGTGLSWKP